MKLLKNELLDLFDKLSDLVCEDKKMTAQILMKAFMDDFENRYTEKSESINEDVYFCMHIDECIAEVLELYRNSPSTCKAYKLDMKQFSGYCKKNNVKKLDSIVLRRYISELQQKNKALTVKRKMASVHVLCNYMREKGVMNNNPFSEIKNREYAAKVTLPKSPPLANNDEEKLLKYIDGQIDSGNISKIKELSIFLLIYEKCLRVDEIINLKRQDVIIDSNGTVFLKIHKYGVSKRVVTVEYYKRTAIFMKLYLSMINSGEDDFIFLNSRARNTDKLYTGQAVRWLIRRYMRAAGINEKVVIMNIRATSIRNQSQNCSVNKLSTECGITHHVAADWIKAVEGK